SDPLGTNRYADLYQLTLNATTQVTIDMRSAMFDPVLVPLSSSGSFYSATFVNDVSGTGYAQLGAMLPAGTYYVEASSSALRATGAYTISINVLPVLGSVDPPFAAAGTAMPVTLTGARFGAPMTADIAGGTVTDLNIVSQSSATATINMPAGTPA